MKWELCATDAILEFNVEMAPRNVIDNRNIDKEKDNKKNKFAINSPFSALWDK